MESEANTTKLKLLFLSTRNVIFRLCYLISVTAICLRIWICPDMFLVHWNSDYKASTLAEWKVQYLIVMLSVLRLHHSPTVLLCLTGHYPSLCANKNTWTASSNEWKRISSSLSLLKTARHFWWLYGICASDNNKYNWSEDREYSHWGEEITSRHEDAWV